MKKPKHWHCEVWGVNFWFFVSWSQEDFESYMVKHFSIEVQAKGYDGKCLRLERGVILWTRTKSIPTLAHECVHAATACLEAKGVIADWNNDEPLAYLVAALMRKAV